MWILDMRLVSDRYPQVRPPQCAGGSLRFSEGRCDQYGNLKVIVGRAVEQGKLSTHTVPFLCVSRRSALHRDVWPNF